MNQNSEESHEEFEDHDEGQSDRPQKSSDGRCKEVTPLSPDLFEDDDTD